MNLAEYKALLASRRQSGKATAIEKPSIRLPNLDGPNQTEQSLRTHLQSDYPDASYTWRYEEVKFKLPSGTLYTPDWTVWKGNVLHVVIEVKGPHIHNATSLEKFKALRAAWPGVNVRFYQFKNQQWTQAK